MKKILFFLFFLLMSIGVWGAAATMSAGSNASTATVNGHPAIKIGTSKNSGNMTITVPATSIKLTVYIASWKGENSNTVSITPNTKITPISVSLISDDGIANNSPFTLIEAESIYKFEFTLSNITTSTIFTLSANKRFVVWGAEYETPSKYTISFVNNLGKSPNNITQETFGSAISLPKTIDICNKCYEENWEFEGWTPSKTNYSIVYKTTFTPTHDTVLYALYTRKGIKDIKIVEYKRVTSAQTDWSGDYLIAYSSDIFANGQIGGKTGIGSHASYVTPSENLIGDSVVLKEWGDLYYITLEEISEGSNTYLLKTQDGLYNYWTNNTKNGVETTLNINTADDYPIMVNFVSSNDIQLSLGGEAIGSVFRWNDITGVNGKMFRFYRDCSQNPIYLYKKQTSIYPSPIEHTIAPECDSSFITTWNKDKLFIDKGLLYNLDGKTVTIKDIDTDETLSNSITYDSSTDLYQINTDLAGKECDKINIFIRNNTDSTYLIYKVPFIVDADTYTTSMADENCDVVVLTGKKLTVSGTESEHRDVKLYEGAHLSVPSGTEYTVNSLSLRKTDDTNPYLTLNGNISLAGDSSFYLDVYTDPSEWVWLALPDTFDLRKLRLSNGKPVIYGEDYLIKTYNGYIRALTQNNGWVTVSPDKQFMPGEGFIFGISGSGTIKKEFRFKFSNNIIIKEKSDKKLEWDDLQSWGCGDTELRPNHKGWNLIGNAFLDKLNTEIYDPSGIGKLVHSDTDPWDGKWEIEEGTTGKLRYRVIHKRNSAGEDGNGYSSELLDNVQLEPFSAFFIQLGGNEQVRQTILLKHEKRRNMMQRMIEASCEDDELFLRVFVGNKKTGMFISNKFTEGYEPGDDLESRQTIYQNIGGYKLLYSAIPDSTIEKGVLINAPSGKLFLDDKINLNNFEYIYVNYGNSWYNLLQGETVDIETGTFVLQAKRKKEDTPTGLDIIPTKGIYKFTNGDYICINNNGELINVLGKKIK